MKSSDSTVMNQDANRWKISHKALLAIYLIFPLCFLGYLVDQLFLDAYLRSNLRVAPEHYFWLAIFFGTPHILASNVILFSNKEYLETYWKNVALVTIGIIAFFSVGNYLLSYNALFAIVATVTIIHVVRQQIGIGNSLARMNGWLFNLWSWSVIFSGIILYNAIFLRHVFTPANRLAAFYGMLFLSGIILLLATIASSRINNPMGKAFLWANSGMALLSFFFYEQGYYFFAVLGPRVTHDVTAFMFYVVHDYNRHHVKAKNGLYGFFNVFRIPAFVVVPGVAIGLTFVLQSYGDLAFNQLTQWLFNIRVPKAITLGFIGYLSLLHYYTEAFTWKTNSPYRKFI